MSSMIVRALRKFNRQRRIASDPVGVARSLGVQIGDGCRIIGMTDQTFGSEPYLVSLGNHVEVTSGVRFITHDGGVWTMREEHPSIDVIAPIQVGDNVFIGASSIILPGVEIGSDVVVGAGAIVVDDVPPRSVVAGVPSRKICSIDDYWTRMLQEGIQTHGQPSREKRATILREIERKKHLRSPGEL